MAKLSPETAAALTWAKRALKKKGIRQVAAADHFGVSLDTFHGWLARGTRFREWFLPLCIRLAGATPTAKEIKAIMDEPVL